MIKSVEFATVAVAGKCPLGMEGSPYGECHTAESIEQAKAETTARLLRNPEVVQVAVWEAHKTCIFVTGLDNRCMPVEGYGIMIDYYL